MNSFVAFALLLAATACEANFNGQITALQLINAKTNKNVVNLSNGAVINIATLGLTAPAFNINATVSGNDVQSVRFAYNGTKYRDSSAPFLSFCGNGVDNYWACSKIGYGQHTVTATPFSNRSASGFAGATVSVTFTIVTNGPVAAPVKAPVVVPVATKAPVAAPVATKAPVAAPIESTVGLKGCFLVDLNTRVETLLTGVDRYMFNATSAKGYSIRCDADPNAGFGLDFMKFSYNGKVHDEFGEPRWLDGDSFPTDHVVPVAFLTACGTKTINVEGHSWTALRFSKTYTLTALCPGVPTAPVAVPTRAPLAVAVPTKAPVAAPVVVVPTAPQQCKNPKLVGSWVTGKAHPFPVAEAQGAMIGKWHVIVGGFLKGYTAVSTQTHILDTTLAKPVWERQDDYPFKIGITHGAFVVVGTKFYICGGYAGGGIGMHTDVCMVYDNSQPKGQGKQWSTFAPLPNGGRAGGGMVYDRTLNALIFSAGATRPIPQKRTALDHSNTWLFSLSNPAAGWVSKAPMPFHANHMSSVTAIDATGKQRHYFTGGQKGEDEHDGNQIEHFEYDALADKWIKRKFMTIPRSHAASSTRAIGCGFIMVAGCTNGGKKIADISYYDTLTDTWTSIGALSSNINTPVCDISPSGMLFCDSGWDSGSFSRKIAITL